MERQGGGRELRVLGIALVCAPGVQKERTLPEAECGNRELDTFSTLKHKLLRDIWEAT